jgi:hypothetical protein
MHKPGTEREWAIAGVLLVLLTPLAFPADKEAKLTPQELVARHLESLGSKEARAAAKSRVAQGNGRLKVLVGGHADMFGPSAFVTEGPREMFVMDFPFKQYPREALAYDGQKVHVPDVIAGTRPRLGDFLFTYDQILREGLLGGALSTAWPLLSPGEHAAELKYTGLKKVEGKELHQLEYRTKRRGGDLKITLFFEPETYRHVMSTYELTASASVGAGRDQDQFSGHRSSQSASQLPDRYKLEERFSDFRSFDGMTLPFHWTIELTTERNQQTSVWQWEVMFSKIAHNQGIDPKVFSLEQ